MIWLAALTSALSLQNAEPVTADCQLSWAQAGSRWEPGVTCPNAAPEAEALQAVAADILQQSLVRIESYFPLRPSTLTFVMTDSGRDLSRVTPLHRAPPRYPAYAAADGVAARCRGVVELRENGRRRRDTWDCRTNHENGPDAGARSFERAATDAARESYWLIPNRTVAPCTEVDLEFNTERSDGSTAMAPNFPDDESPQCPA